MSHSSQMDDIHDIYRLKHKAMWLFLSKNGKNAYFKKMFA